MAQTNRLRRHLFKIPFFLCIVCVVYLLFQSKDFKAKYQTRSDQYTVFNSTVFNASSVIESYKFHWSNSSQSIEIVMLFTHVQDHIRMKDKLIICLSSLFEHTTTPLHILLITDDSSLPIARDVLLEVTAKYSNKLQVDFYHVDNVVDPLHEMVSYMQPHFTYKEGAYYSDALFFLSIGIHRVFPHKKLIMMDIDIKFLSDVKELHSHFKKFGSNAVIGIAQEQQPVYRHLLHIYRRKNPSTRIGSPSPKGMQGFNSGVLLLNLERMRRSRLYNGVINAETVERLTKKYSFKGHLGDQDFFSLISFEYEELFYVLPCTWNRQLCQWWKYHGYESVFDAYYKCKGKINIYHGNCNAYLPD
ncbi:xyloside xylosyltransferase 1-like isoform X1 [Centruroides sculpturatus]|uniref:xyloside xylosyltransferase 1-like isoform X1 n=1 Tax=Centruroides sculpturatus TaxID=218467 RepID=UPI000C6E70D9|nr:xyloside xylosyltransferase 1-like isoform X1 [Centruroides sculpturatus]